MAYVRRQQCGGGDRPARSNVAAAAGAGTASTRRHRASVATAAPQLATSRGPAASECRREPAGRTVGCRRRRGARRPVDGRRWGREGSAVRAPSRATGDGWRGGGTRRRGRGGTPLLRAGEIARATSLPPPSARHGPHVVPCTGRPRRGRTEPASRLHVLRVATLTDVMISRAPATSLRRVTRTRASYTTRVRVQRERGTGSEKFNAWTD